MASPPQWTWVWVNSGSWRWTGRPGMLQSMGSQRVGHNWVTTELNIIFYSFPGGSDYKESACFAEHLGLIPGSERSPGGGNGNPLKYSCLENSMDREEPGRLYSIGSRRAGHDWATNTYTFYFLRSFYMNIIIHCNMHLIVHEVLHGKLQK